MPINVLVITCDQMKASATSVGGNPQIRMPAIERLAREGTTLTNAFVQMPKCVPSRVSMMTARYPHVDGYRTLMGRRHWKPCPGVKDNHMLVLQEDDPNAIPIVREAGYSTCLLGKNHLVEWNLHKKWFDATPSWKFNKTPKFVDAPEPDSDLRRAYYRGRVSPENDLTLDCDAVTATETVDYLRKCKADGKPFFALVDMGKPHTPYDLYPTPTADIPLEQIPLPPWQSLEEAPSLMRQVRIAKDCERLTDDDRRKIVRAYWSMCEWADRQVGRILAALDELDLADDTLVIYTADHGDYTTEHNGYEKWDTCFYDCLTHVPLVMRWPGNIPAGARSEALVELVDLLPTAFEAMGLARPIWFQGRSLWPLLRNEQAEHRDAVFCTGGVEASALPLIGKSGSGDSIKQRVLHQFPEALARGMMVRTKDWKLIYRVTGDCELYDLVNDPHELRNRYGDPECAAMQHQLIERLLRFSIDTQRDLPELASVWA